jgi:hypothetical protein
MGVSWTICLGWPGTVILCILVSQVARITGVSHWHLTGTGTLNKGPDDGPWVGSMQLYLQIERSFWNEILINISFFFFLRYWVLNSGPSP